MVDKIKLFVLQGLVAQFNCFEFSVNSFAKLNDRVVKSLGFFDDADEALVVSTMYATVYDV